MKKIYDNDISFLNLSLNIKNKLEDNLTIKELCLKTRNDLKNMNFNQEEINEIIIKLQLNGLDLGRKYK